MYRTLSRSLQRQHKSCTGAHRARAKRLWCCYHFCRFFLFLVYLFLIHQMGTSLFRLMGALGREISRTNVFGSFALVLVILLGGFALKYDDIHPW